MDPLGLAARTPERPAGCVAAATPALRSAGPSATRGQCHLGRGRTALVVRDAHCAESEHPGPGPRVGAEGRGRRWRSPAPRLTPRDGQPDASWRPPSSDGRAPIDDCDASSPRRPRLPGASRPCAEHRGDGHDHHRPDDREVHRSFLFPNAGITGLLGGQALPWHHPACHNPRQYKYERTLDFRRVPATPPHSAGEPALAAGHNGQAPHSHQHYRHAQRRRLLSLPTTWSRRRLSSDEPAASPRGNNLLHVTPPGRTTHVGGALPNARQECVAATPPPQHLTPAPPPRRAAPSGAPP